MVLFLGTFATLMAFAPGWVGEAIRRLSGVHPAALAEQGGLWGRLGSMASFIAFTLLLSLTLVEAFCRYVDRRRLQALGWSPRGQRAEIAGGVLLGCGILLTGFLLLLAGGQVHVVSAVFHPAVLGAYFGITLLVALQEELVFRGYVLRNLMDSFPPRQALALSALVFVLVHVSGRSLDPVLLLNAFLGGLLLGMRYVVTLNLWFAVALHLSWNFVEGPVLGFGVSGLPVTGLLALNLEGDPRWTGGRAGLEGSLLLVPVLVAALAGMAVWARRGVPSTPLGTRDGG